MITNTYPFLQNMKSITIEQDENNKNEFIVSCFTDNMETPNIIKRFDRKEKREARADSDCTHFNQICTKIIKIEAN